MIIMPTVKKLRKSGGVLVLSLPAQVMRLYGMQEGDNVEIIPMGGSEFRIRKILGDK